MFTPTSPPLRLPPFSTQSDRRGWTQAANKTRIRRESTHILGCSEKVSEHAQSRPHPLTHVFSFITPLTPSFLPSFPLFVSLTPVFPLSSSALSFQNTHNGASRNYSFCRGCSANSQCHLHTSPTYLDPMSFPVMIMKCVPSQ